MSNALKEFLDDPEEIHAFVNGYYIGFVEWKAPSKYNNGKERHYWQGGFILGWLSKVAIIVYFGQNFVPV